MRRRRIGGMNVGRKRKAGPERKVWAYLGGQAFVRSLQTDERGGEIALQSDAEERIICRV